MTHTNAPGPPGRQVRPPRRRTLLASGFALALTTCGVLTASDAAATGPPPRHASAGDVAPAALITPADDIYRLLPPGTYDPRFAMFELPPRLKAWIGSPADEWTVTRSVCTEGGGWVVVRPDGSKQCMGGMYDGAEVLKVRTGMTGVR